MWLLENDGDIFHGRRLWLRPGKKYLFGRTASGGKHPPHRPLSRGAYETDIFSPVGEYVAFEKTISRKHLTIEVGTVTEGEGVRIWLIVLSPRLCQRLTTRATAKPAQPLTDYHPRPRYEEGHRRQR